MGFTLEFLMMGFLYVALAYLMHKREQDSWFLLFMGMSLVMLLLASGDVAYLSEYTEIYNVTGTVVNFGTVALGINAPVFVMFLGLVLIAWAISFLMERREAI